MFYLNREVKLFVIIVVITLLIALIFRVFGELIFFDYLTEFSATMLGVLFAFNLNRHLESRKQEQVKNDLLCDICDELKESRDKLNGNSNLHFPDIWKSAISSGQVRLLSSEQVRKISSVYEQIQAIEYEAKWVKQTKEDFETCEPNLSNKLAMRHGKLAAIQIDHEKKLRIKIEELLKEKWWNKK